MAKRTNRAQRFTSGAQLNAWREAHELYVRELAFVLGMPLATLKDRLYCDGDITMRMDRAIENIELLLKLGCPPAGWPVRLRRRIVAAPIDYTVTAIERQSPEICGDCT